MTDRQIHPFNKSRVQSSSEAHLLQSDLESSPCSKAHDVRHPHQLAPLVAFLHLAVEQSFCHLPPEYFPPSASHLEPVSKMGRERIEVQIEPITGEKGDATRCEDVPQGVNDGMCRQLCTWSHMQGRKNFRARIDGQPEPEYLPLAAEPCAQFIQLQVWALILQPTKEWRRDNRQGSQAGYVA